MIVWFQRHPSPHGTSSSACAWARFGVSRSEALAKIHQSMGNLDLAFESMKKAYYMSGQDKELLLALGELASQSSDLKSAIYYRRQLVLQEDEEADVDSWKSASW